MRLGIVADDLTGAMDTGVQFAKRGLHTVVMLRDGELPPAEVVVISTDSRDQPTGIAHKRAQEAAKQLAGRAVYKKIDSTLRGNLGPELEGLLEGLGMGHALVAPAFPATGRTTVDGYHRVNGVLISESSFARDPLWPIAEPHLPTLLQRQTALPVGHLSLSTVGQGDEAVRAALQEEKASLVVADAAEPYHLQTIARVLAEMPDWLPCGSAGLAEEWSMALGPQKGESASLAWSPDPRPVLVVVGSRHPATGIQLQVAAQESGLELVRLPEDGEWTERTVAGAALLLRQGRSVALTTSFSQYREGQGDATASGLASAARKVADLIPVAGVFMTGGDIARAVCRELGGRAIQALGEVQVGIPAGLLVGGRYDGLRVVTKAGGFGDDLAILRSIQTLRGRRT